MEVHHGELTLTCKNKRKRTCYPFVLSAKITAGFTCLGLCVKGEVGSSLNYGEVLVGAGSGRQGRVWCLRFTLVIYLSAGLGHIAARANRVSL